MSIRQAISPEKIKEKIYRYCAYQERCHTEVREKLLSLGASRDHCEELLSTLITDGFLNEERFAKAFAGGKFRMKRWGRIKIQKALEMRNISPNCIAAGLKEIGAQDYLTALTTILTSKAEGLDPNRSAFEKKGALATYAIQKGYEPDFVWETIHDLFGR